MCRNPISSTYGIADDRECYNCKQIGHLNWVCPLSRTGGRESDWIYRDVRCGNLNFARKTKCYKCGASRLIMVVVGIIDLLKEVKVKVEDEEEVATGPMHP